MSRQRTARALIIRDDEEVQPEELNPFSFREFLRWKNQDQDQDQDQEDQTHSQSDFDDGNLTSDPRVERHFFSEPSPASQLEKDEEGDGGWEQSLQSSVDITTSLCMEEEEETRFSTKPEDLHRGGENYEGDDETSVAEPLTSWKRKSRGSSQLQQLKEENVLLRRTIQELQGRLRVNEERVVALSEELLQRRRREEEEAQDLENMVQSVEQNLHLMTKRAMKAESSVSKLRSELQQLQMEVESLQLDNNRLKAVESEVIMTMRQNAQVASEYLSKTASHAHSSICKLLGEAETLRLVSQLLQSIDKMSSVNTES